MLISECSFLFTVPKMCSALSHNFVKLLVGRCYELNVFPPNSYVEAQTLNVMVFGDGSRGGVRDGQGREGGALLQKRCRTGESPRRGTRVLHRGGGGRGEPWTECKKESKCTPELKMKKCSLDKE